MCDLALQRSGKSLISSNEEYIIYIVDIITPETIKKTSQKSHVRLSSIFTICVSRKEFSRTSAGGSYVNTFLIWHHFMGNEAKM